MMHKREVTNAFKTFSGTVLPGLIATKIMRVNARGEPMENGPYVLFELGRTSFKALYADFERNTREF